MDGRFYEINRDTIEKIKDIDKQIHEEMESEKCNNGKITKLMYEQLLRGLYLNNNVI